ncbi:metalloprotease TIKI1 isoform X4 [Tiliqua scincoides]|uniref:metalloprotease TIKI1 isoform X4 n=1 Tax=Tiliqua scincoides TaxID=71010 RepID=UPI003462C515
MVVHNAGAGLLLNCLLLLLAGAKQSRDPAATSCELHRKQSELNSFLWTIKRDPPSYFFGTIHVPYTRVWDFIPENSKKAFQQSHIVYFELDLTDPYTISALTSCQLLPQGENLQDVLPRDIYRRLKRHLEYVKLMMPSWMTPDQRGKGLYADYLFNAIAGNWERKRPVWVMLMVNSLTEVDIKSRGVPVLDLYLAQEAERLRKRTGAVEKVEEQCHPLNGLNFSQDQMTLPTRLLKELAQDTAELLAISFATSWRPGHFMGNNTVIDVLRREGYAVEHTPAGQAINSGKLQKVLSALSSSSPEYASYIISQELPLSQQHPQKEEEELLPHLLLPENIDLLEKVDRKYKKKKKKQQKKQRLRQFNDLWVRIEERRTRAEKGKVLKKNETTKPNGTHSATDPPPRIRIINGYITVEPQPRGHRRSSHIQSDISSSKGLFLILPTLTWTLIVPAVMMLMLE